MRNDRNIPASRRPTSRPPAGRRAAPSRPPTPPAIASADFSHLRAIVELAEDAVFVKDTRLRYLYVNPAAVKYLGVPAAKLVGRTDAQVFGPAQSRETDAIDRRVLRLKRAVSYERRGRSAGSERVFLTTKVPYRSPRGKLLGLIGISREITERKRAEDELARSETKYRLLLNSIRSPVLALDERLRVVYCNRSYAEFVGKRPAEIEGSDLLRVFPRLRRSKTLAAYRRVLASGKPRLVEGTMGDQHIRAQVFRTPGGLLAIAEDVTAQRRAAQELERARGELEATVRRRTGSLARSNQELQKEAGHRRRIEQTLRDSETKYRAILENSQDIITILNEDGLVKYANPALTAVLGYEVDDILGKNVFEYLHPSDAPGIIKLLGELHQQPGAATKTEVRLRHADGGWRLLEVSSKHIPASRLLGGIVINARDITEGRRAQDEARETEDRQRLLFDLAPDAYFLCDFKGQVVDGNRAFETLAGAGRDALAGKSLWDLNLLPIDQAPEMTALLARNALGEVAGPDAFTLSGSDGRAFRAEIKTHPVKIKGQPLVLGVITDVTASAREREHEREQYRGLEFLARTANQFVKLDPTLDLAGYIADQMSEWLDGAIVGVNLYDPEIKAILPSAVAGLGPFQDAAERILGFNPVRQRFTDLPEDIRQRMLSARLVKLADGIHDLFFRTVPRPVCRALEAQLGVSAVYGMGLVSNQRLLGTVTIVLRDGQQLATAVIETFVNQAAVAIERRLDEEELRRDISERQRATEALRKSDEFGRAVIDHSPLGISVRTPGGELLTCNAAWKRIWGISDQALIDDIIARRAGPSQEHDPALLGGWWPAVQRVYREGGTLFVPELRVAGPAPDGRWLALHYYALQSAGSVEQVIVVTEDISERRAGEELVKRSEQHFRALIERSSEVITILDQDGVIRYKSPSVTRELGYDPAELAGAAVFEYIHPDDAPALRQAFMDILEHPGAQAAVEFRFRHKDGRWVALSAVGQNLLKDPAVAGVVINSRNVTERLAAEQALRDSEQRYRTLSETSPDLIFTVDRAGVVQYANEACGRAIGRRPAEFTGLRVDAIFGGATARRQGQNLRRVFETGEPLYVEGESEFPQGARCLETWLVPLKDAAGTVQFVQGISRDVTEHKSAARALRETEQRYRNLVENMADGVYRTTADGRFLELNQAMVRIFRYGSRDEMLAADIPHDLYFNETDRFRNYPAPGADRTRALRMKRKDGSEVWVEDSCRYIRDEQGEVVVHEGVLRDITERVRAERALRESEAINRAISDLTTDYSFIVDVAAGGALTLRWASANMEQVTGHSVADAATPDLWRAIIHPDDQERFFSFTARTVADGRPGDIECRSLNRGGAVRWIQVFTQPLRDESGAVVSIQGAVKDITARKQTELALLESEQRFRELADALPETVFEFGLDRRFTYVNRTGFEKFGYTDDDFRSGLTADQMIAPQERPEAIGRILARLGGGEPVRTEFTAIRKDGTTFPVQIFARPVTAEGAIAGLRGIVIDVSRIRQAELQYRSTLDAMHDHIHLVDRDLKVLFINQSFVTLNRQLGLDTDIIGKDLFAVYPFLGDDVRDQYRRVFERGEIVTTQERNVVAGREIATETRKIPVFEDGRVSRAVTVIRDITERVQREQALRQLSARQEALLSAIPDIVMEVDAAKVYRWANPAGIEFFGEDVVGREAAHYFEGEQATYEAVQPLFDGDESVIHVESWQRRRDGEKRLLAWWSRVLKDDQGQVTGALSSARDITERRQSEERVKYLTYHDRLTGLANRAWFEERIKELDRPEQHPLSLVMGDANGLKLVNDAFGHDAGDRFLQRLAGIIESCARPGDQVFRWGGDEFVILMPRTGNEAAQAVCDAIQRACGDAPEDPIQPSIALGAGTKSSPAQPATRMMMEAEDRMYRHKLVESKSLRSSIISSLGRTLWEADYETEEHALRLQALARDFGRSLKLSDGEMNDLMMLAALHDIGKIAIADGILLKPTMLSETEWEAVRKHPEIGFRIAQASPELAPIADGILHHHERWDGSGYPQGLQGEHIPVIARVLAIIDAYDVMTEKRLYKTTISKDEAIAELERCAGTQFDPALVKLFVKIISRK